MHDNSKHTTVDYMYMHIFTVGPVKFILIYNLSLEIGMKVRMTRRKWR